MRKSTKKISENEVFNRILDTINKQGIRQKDLMLYIGASDQTFTKWKYCNGRSYMKYIDKIAEYLNVTKEYLLNGTVDYSDDDKEFIQRYSTLSDNRKKIFRDLMQEFSTCNA